MPFAFDTFFLQEKTLAFACLMQRYNIPMREAQRVIDRGRLICNGDTVTQKNAQIAGDIKVLLFMPKSRGLEPIFKTDRFLVFDKPSGILVHPKKVLTPYSMLDEVRTFGTPKSNGVHRIDMETSGLFLASMNPENERVLKGMFEKKEIHKTYLAWVRGDTPQCFTVDEPIKSLQDYTNSKHKVAIDKSGKSAKTEFYKIVYDKLLDTSLLHIKPFTGRTHQIRIHLFHMKHPIIGDPLYGTNFETATAYLEERLTEVERVRFTGAPRLMLHANTLEFTLGNRYYIKSRVNFYKQKALIAPVKERDFADLNDFQRATL